MRTSTVITPWRAEPEDLIGRVLGAAFMSEVSIDLFGVVVSPSIDEIHRVDLVFPGLLVPTVRGEHVNLLSRDHPFSEPSTWGGVAERFGKALSRGGAIDDMDFNAFSISGCVFSFFGGMAGALRFDGPMRERFAQAIVQALELGLDCPAQVNSTQAVNTVALYRT